MPYLPGIGGPSPRAPLLLRASVCPAPPDRPARMPSSPPLVVAIDGPAASGKGTTAKALARALGDGWAYLDTGAMYRAVTVAALDAGVDLGDPASAARVTAIARGAQVDLDPVTGGVSSNGRDGTGVIRTQRVAKAVIVVAKIPEVRRVMMDLQRGFATRCGSIVAEGRDMATVVFPGAFVKIYLDATLKERARRRYEEERRKGSAVTLEEIERSIAERDREDEERGLAPLVRAPDAVVVDRTGRTPAQVLDEVLALVRSRIPPVASR